MNVLLVLYAATTIGGDSLKSHPAPPDSQVIALPFEVVVTASRMSIPLRESAAGTSIVNTAMLSTMPRGVALDEALFLIPGVKTDNQANGERVHLSMRGQGILTETGIRSIKILLDEIPVNDPSGFAPDLFDVDFKTVERIEVLRGPATSLYGGGAAGGILNIVTKNSGKTPLFGEVSAAGGTNGFWKGTGQFGGDVNNVNYRASFSRTSGDGYRLHTHFWQNNIYAKATYTPGPSFQVTPILSWSNTYHENPEGLSLAQYLQDPKLPNDDAIPFNEHMEMNRTTAGLTGVIRVHGDHEIRFNGYAKHASYSEANNRAFDHQNLSTGGTSLQYAFNSGSPANAIHNQVSTGADLQWQTNEERLSPNDHSFEGPQVLARQRIWQRGMGIFLIDRIDVGNAWSIMGSMRLDRIDNELTDLMTTDSSNKSGSARFSNVTGRLGLTFALTPDITLYGAWGQGFIPPSTQELGTNPAGYGGFNAGLKPATSNSFELGARGALAGRLDADVTGFVMTTANDFERYRIPGRGNGKEGTFYKNVGATRRYGIELSAHYQPVNLLSLRIAYTYSHFQYDVSAPIRILMDDSTLFKQIAGGNWLPNSPQHRLAACLTFGMVSDLTVVLTAEMTSKTYIDGANVESEAAPGYALLGGQISYRWNLGGVAGVLSVTARNLGDSRYVAFTEPDPGGNAYQPGSGREFLAGVAIQL